MGKIDKLNLAYAVVRHLTRGYCSELLAALKMELVGVPGCEVPIVQPCDQSDVGSAACDNDTHNGVDSSPLAQAFSLVDTRDVPVQATLCGLWQPLDA